MPGKRIPALTAIAGASTANDDNLVIYDTSEGTTKRILRSQLAAGLVGDLPYTPSGGIAATTVPTAIAELDSEAAKSTTLAASSGSSLVGYTQGGSGASATTVQAKLREGASIKDFGGVGNGSTSDQTAVDNAIASGYESVRVNDDLKFLVTSLSNNRGVELDGYGHIVKAISGGLQKLNSYGDKHQYVFGSEYMAAFHNLLITQHTSPSRKPIMVFSGDSTTAGAGVSSDYQIQVLLKLAGEVAGLQTPYGLSAINRGQSGANTEQWRTTYLSGDLAANPDLLVLRWGINDPGWLKNGTTPPLDAGQDYPNRRDVNDFLTSLRTGLATIRASRSLSSLSILLMAPNATADTPNARDELWYEQIVPGIKQAARDYQCAFIDTYAYLRDSRPAANIWMDDPFGDGRGIHPLNVMNTWIAGLMSSVIFPEGLRQKLGRANLRNIGGAEATPASTVLPSAYDYSLSINRASGSAWPFEGSVVTIRSQDEIVIQINSPFQTSATPRRFAYRMGRAVTLGGFAAGWEPWQILGESSASVAPASGYTSAGMRTVINGSIVVADGYINKSTAATIPANTTVGTVAVGYRPVNDAFYGIATIFGGGSFETVRCRVNSTGEVVLIQATTLSADRVYLNASWTTFA
jgi:lysophospholipase L1-like esterase